MNVPSLHSTPARIHLAYTSGTPSGVTISRSLFAGGSPELRLPGAAAELHAALPPKSAALLPPADPQLFQLGGGRLETSLVEAAPQSLEKCACSDIKGELVIIFVSGAFR